MLGPFNKWNDLSNYFSTLEILHQNFCILVRICFPKNEHVGKRVAVTRRQTTTLSYFLDFHKCIVKGVEIYFKIQGDHCACVRKMKSWISHDWKPIKINVLHPVKMCSTSTLWWMNRDMIRNINWVGNIKK